MVDLCVVEAVKGFLRAPVFPVGTSEPAAEMEDAKLAYAHARETYKKILAECEVD